MSVIEKNNYSNCPLKKRPIYVIKEEIEIVPEINDAVPVDLSSSTRKKPYKIEKINNDVIDLSESRLPPIKENIKEEIYEYHQHHQEQQQSFCNDISYPNSEAWYGNELRYNCNTSTNSSQGFTTNRLDLLSQNSHRENSMSPHPPPSPIIRVNNCSDYRETIYKNPYRNYNNNVVSTPALHYPDQQHNIIATSDYLMLSPSSSHLSYGSNQSDIGDYSEPEDLSVRNKKKILMPTDSSVNIEKHKKTYSELGNNDLYYQCRSCNKCYSTYGGLVKHQQTHTLQNELRSNEIAELKTIPMVPRTDFTGKNKLNEENSKILTSPRYKCKDCGKSYSTFSGLTKHQQFHCPAAEGNQVKKLFSCKNCEKVYVSLGALKMHIRTHTLPCKCPLCGKAFSRPWLLQGHIRTHTGEKPFTCEHCHRAFADRSNLRAHLQTHSDVKKYSCTSCTKTFSRMSLLGKHLQGGCPGMTSNCPNYNDHEYYEEQTQYEDKGRRQTVDNTTSTDGHHRIVYEKNSNTSRDYTTVEHLYKEDVGIYC